MVLVRFRRGAWPRRHHALLCGFEPRALHDLRAFLLETLAAPFAKAGCRVHRGGGVGCGSVAIRNGFFTAVYLYLLSPPFFPRLETIFPLVLSKWHVLARVGNGLGRFGEAQR